jgi:hypothetical protein
VPEDLREESAASQFADKPFRPLYRTDAELAEENSNRTVYGVMHLAWTNQGNGRYRAQMTVYVKPRGAIYLFPKLDLKRYKIKDDQQMVLDFLIQEKVLLVQGTAFNWPERDHLRIVFLPREDELTKAITRLGNFLEHYSQ